MTLLMLILALLSRYAEQHDGDTIVRLMLAIMQVLGWARG